MFNVFPSRFTCLFPRRLCPKSHEQNGKRTKINAKGMAIEFWKPKKQRRRWHLLLCFLVMFPYTMLGFRKGRFKLFIWLPYCEYSSVECRALYITAFPTFTENYGGRKYMNATIITAVPKSHNYWFPQNKTEGPKSHNIWSEGISIQLEKNTLVLVQP